MRRGAGASTISPKFPRSANEDTSLGRSSFNSYWPSGDLGVALNGVIGSASSRILNDGLRGALKPAFAESRVKCMSRGLTHGFFLPSDVLGRAIGLKLGGARLRLVDEPVFHRRPILGLEA